MKQSFVSNNIFKCRDITTQVLIGILDSFIDQAVKDLFETCGMYRRLILRVAVVNSKDFRKRFGAIEFEKAFGIILAAVYQKDWHLLRTAEIDRSLLINIAKYCNDLMKPSLEAEKKVCNGDQESLLILYNISNVIQVDYSKISKLYKKSRYYIALYDTYVTHLHGKYGKKIVKDSSYISRVKQFVDQKQLESNMYLAMGKAIDRCNVLKGTLTTFTESHMMTVINSPEFDHCYNISYVVPPNVKKRKEKAGEKLENYSNTLESLDSEPTVNPYEAADIKFFTDLDNNFLSGFKRIKDSEIAFISLGIPIVLNDEEKQILINSNQR